MSAANRAVASSSGNVMVKLVPAAAVGNMMAPVSGMIVRPRQDASSKHASSIDHAGDKHGSILAQPCIATTMQQIPQNRQYSKPPICHSYFPLLWRHTAHAATNKNIASSEA